MGSEFGWVNDQKLEDEFHDAMLNVYKQAALNGYPPTYFLRIVEGSGGLAAAKRLLRTQGIPSGLRELAKRGCLGISMEALVMQRRWAGLFSEEERDIARVRLVSLLSQPLPPFQS